MSSNLRDKPRTVLIRRTRGCSSHVCVLINDSIDNANTGFSTNVNVNGAPGWST